MTLGMSLEVFTLVHVLISIVGIGAGFGVLYGLLNGPFNGPWTATFLFFTVLTNVTGLMFPFNGFLPSHAFAILSLVHVLISIVAIGAGFGVLYGLLNGPFNGPWTATFLLFTVLTNVTGLMFPFNGFLPSHAFAILSLILLAVAIFALYVKHLAGPWRTTYVVTAMLSLYLNVFVLLAQMFTKVPLIKALAPNGSEPPFGITQGLVLAVFIWLIYAAAKRFRRSVV